MDEENNSCLGTVIGWIVAVVVIFFVIGLISDSGKYEGESAEFWFNAYDQENANYDKLKSCVEDYAYYDDYEQLVQVKDCIE